MYVLDTNTLIYFFKGIGNVADKLLAVPPTKVAIPSIVIYELEFGIAKSSSPAKRKKQLAALCSTIFIIPFTDNEGKESAKIRYQLENQGTPIGPYDTLIAGTARAQNATLVTNNIAEFERVEGLKLENWR